MYLSNQARFQVNRKTGGKLPAASIGFEGLADSSPDHISLCDFKYSMLGVTFRRTKSLELLVRAFAENHWHCQVLLFINIPVLFLGAGSSTPALILVALEILSGKGGLEEDTIECISKHEGGHFFLCIFIHSMSILFNRFG